MAIEAGSNQNFDSFVPVYDVVPEEWEYARQFIIEQLKKITNSLNAKEIGFFLDEELVSGKLFIPGATNPQAFRTVLRTVINFGALPNTGSKSVAHNVTVDGNFTLVSMWLSATDPIGLVGFSLAYWSIGASDIALSYNSTDVVVSTSSNYSAYTRSYVIMEYIQEL
jgi:hypothetical protein